MFDQEFAEFARPKYEEYLRHALTPPANTPDEKMKADLVEKLTLEAEKSREREGIVLKMSTDTPQRPPNRRRQPA